MENRLSYEVLIAGKLEQRVIPDMVDSIWARIGQQLDLDMPDGNGGGSTPSTGPSLPGKLWIGFGLSIFITALVLAFLQKSADNDKYEEAKQTPSVDTISSATPQQPPPDRTNIPPEFKPPAPDKNVTAPPAGDAAIPQDIPSPSGTVNAGFEAGNKTDSASAVVTAAPPSPPRDTVLKKKKGVTGISDDDYRIEGKQK